MGLKALMIEVKSYRPSQCASTIILIIVPEEVLEIGVEPAVEDRVGDGGQHRKGVHDEEQDQLGDRFQGSQISDFPIRFVTFKNSQ